MVRLRGEEDDDELSIRALLLEAFDGAAEADLVEALRWQGDLAVSLVAEAEGEIVGYLALSRLKSPSRALALAPLATAARCRRRGLGSALVQEALAHAAHDDAALVFVLGDPLFYGRFGFSLDAARPYPSVFSGEHFMARRIGAARIEPGPAVYPRAFEMAGA